MSKIGLSVRDRVSARECAAYELFRSNLSQNNLSFASSFSAGLLLEDLSCQDVCGGML